MYIALSSVIMDADAANGMEMAEFLCARGVQVIAQVPSLDQLAGLLQRDEVPQVAVVNLDPNPQEMLRRLAPLIREKPQVAFFVLSQVLDPTLLMDAMQAGVRQFVPLPIDEERFVIGLERVAQAYAPDKHARMIQVIPSAGGCGATTVSCNIATALARHGSTALVDLDLVRGSVATGFDLRPRYTIADLMDLNQRLDRQLLDTALAAHEPSGVRILARPELPEEAARVGVAGIGRLLGLLGSVFDYVVIDSQMSLDPVYLSVLQAADLNVIVMQLNVPCVRNAERFRAAMQRNGLDHQKVRLVVNRAARRGWDIDREPVEKALGQKIDWSIPNDFKSAIGATNYGEPVLLRAPRSEMSTSLDGLAQSLNGRNE